MTEASTGDTQPVSTKTGDSSNRVFIMTLLIGILMGMVIVGTLWYGLYFFGYISILGEELPSSVQITEVKVPVCPTCGPTPTERNILVVTPTLTPTSSFGATATAACGSFLERFPGTPCPTLSPP